VKTYIGLTAQSSCNGGAEAGNHCHLACVGGDYDGLPCQIATDCFGNVNGTCDDVPRSSDCPPSGRCVRWAADPATGSCVATTNAPFCNTVADCPTTKYCAGDPQSYRGGPVQCDYSGNGTDACGCVGPCLVWDTCDAVAHVCLRTHQQGQTQSCGGRTVFIYGDAPCLGGAWGIGGLNGGACNNVCLGGRCTSSFQVCM
jgi:hypothetical protein